jgi:hypothetical protein
MSETFGTEPLRSLVAKFGSILILLVFANPLLAQQPPGSSGTPSNDPRDPVNQERTNKADMRDREWRLSNSRTPVRRAGGGPEEAALPQIKEDFERIQFVNKGLMTTVFASNIVDHKQIVKATADIGKRAARLKSNLAYPEPLNRHDARKSRPGNEDEDIKVSLTNLDQSIMSFVMNPIFRLQQQVVDSRLAMKVTSDLMDIVELSDRIKKHAERLEREAKH